MKKKILLGIVPVMASAAIIAGGYAAWVFTTNDSVKGQVGVSVTAESNGVTAGTFSVAGINKYNLVKGQEAGVEKTWTGDNYGLVLDQTANEINTTGESAHFENNLSITYEFLDSIKTSDSNSYSFTFTLSLEISSSLLNYVSFSYDNVTIEKEDVEGESAVKTIKTVSNYEYSGSDYELFNTATKAIEVSYVNEPKSSDELAAMKQAIDGATIEFTATAVATLKA